ncbi:MAG: hypothetical protein IJ352_09335 [Muribaculaceae bacterium]|nr:hypothetical protein [Muribaculaceae bacterium]
MTENIEYAFIAMPTKLTILLDIKCRSMLFTLLQLHSYFADENGWFFRTNADLAEESDLSQKLVVATIDTLYQYGIIDVRCVGKSNGKHSNHFKINFERIKDFEQLEMEQLKNPEVKIRTIDYRKKGYTPSYLNTTQVIPNDSQSANNIDIIENVENKNVIENIEDEEYIIDSFRTKILDLVENGTSIPNILITLASGDWDCYCFYKKELYNNDRLRVEFANNRELIEELNNKYCPQ